MANTVMNVVIYLLAVYGALSIIISIGNIVFTERCTNLKNARLVLMVKDCGQAVEGVVEYILKEGVLKKARVEDVLTIVDLGSTDDTQAVLAKLQEMHECLSLVEYKDREQIFKGLE